MTYRERVHTKYLFGAKPERNKKILGEWIFTSITMKALSEKYKISATMVRVIVCKYLYRAFPCAPREDIAEFMAEHGIRKRYGKDLMS